MNAGCLELQSPWIQVETHFSYHFGNIASMPGLYVANIFFSGRVTLMIVEIQWMFLRTHFTAFVTLNYGLVIPFSSVV